MAPLSYAAKFDPFLSLYSAVPNPLTQRNPRKGRDQILPSGNTEQGVGDGGERLQEGGQRRSGQLRVETCCQKEVNMRGAEIHSIMITAFISNFRTTFTRRFGQIMLNFVENVNDKDG